MSILSPSPFFLCLGLVELDRALFVLVWLGCIPFHFFSGVLHECFIGSAT